MPHVASGNHLLEKDIVHVAQGEESQAQEEESPLLPPVGEVVIPQHHHGKRSQDDQPQQEVQSRDVEEDRQQHERRHEADVDLHGPCEPRDAAAVRNVVGDPLQSAWGQGPAGQPPVGGGKTQRRENTGNTWGDLCGEEAVTPFNCGEGGWKVSQQERGGQGEEESGYTLRGS